MPYVAGGRARRPGGCGSPGRRSSPASCSRSSTRRLRRALDETVELLGSLGHELKERDPDYGNDAIPSVIARYMRGCHDDVAELEHPERLERRTRTFARLGGLVTDGLLAALAAAARRR